jgi:transposase
VPRPTVTKWRSRFVARRLEGLADEPRPGPARTISDQEVEQVLVTTLEATPADATHWSTCSLARQRAAAFQRRDGKRYPAAVACQLDTCPN